MPFEAPAPSPKRDNEKVQEGKKPLKEKAKAGIKAMETEITKTLTEPQKEIFNKLEGKHPSIQGLRLVLAQRLSKADDYNKYLKKANDQLKQIDKILSIGQKTPEAIEEENYCGQAKQEMLRMANYAVWLQKDFQPQKYEEAVLRGHLTDLVNQQLNQNAEQEVTPEHVKKALLYYSLGKHKNSSSDAKTESILEKIESLQHDNTLEKEGIRLNFAGGTDATGYRLPLSKKWHNEKIKAFEKLKSFDVERVQLNTQPDWVLIDQYIDAVKTKNIRNVVRFIYSTKGIRKAFLKGGGLFDVALAVQRAEDIKIKLTGKELDAEKDYLYLEIGNKKNSKNQRKSGIRLSAVGEIPPMYLETPTAKPEKKEKAAPAKTAKEEMKEMEAPAKAPAKKPEPAKTTLAKAAPAKVAPAKVEPAKAEPAKEEKPKKIEKSPEDNQRETDRLDYLKQQRLEDLNNIGNVWFFKTQIIQEGSKKYMVLEQGTSQSTRQKSLIDVAPQNPLNNIERWIETKRWEITDEGLKNNKDNINYTKNWRFGDAKLQVTVTYSGKITITEIPADKKPLAPSKAESKPLKQKGTPEKEKEKAKEIKPSPEEDKEVELERPKHRFLKNDQLQLESKAGKKITYKLPSDFKFELTTEMNAIDEFEECIQVKKGDLSGTFWFENLKGTLKTKGEIWSKYKIQLKGTEIIIEEK